MQLQVDIEFDQLVKIVKKLPTGKLRQLKTEIENEGKKAKAKVRSCRPIYCGNSHDAQFVYCAPK